MKRPNPKDYNQTDIIRGAYENDLEAYINYLERSIRLPSGEAVMNIAIKFAEYCFINGYKISGYDNGQRETIFLKFIAEQLNGN